MPQLHLLLLCPLLANHTALLFLLQAELAPTAEPPHGAAKLGTRRKLVVLRAQRLGAQRVSLDDAVAASLAHRPGCAAAVNLQQLAPPEAARSERSDSQRTAAAAAEAGAAVQRTDDQAATGQAAAAAPLAGAAGGALDSNAAEQEPGGVEGQGEGTGLSAYLSSWFGSPTKARPLSAGPPPGQISAAFGQGLAAAQPGAASARPQRQTAGLTRASSGAAWGPAAGAAAPPAAFGAAEADAAKQLLEQLEEQLSAALPAVGVVHLGLELAGDAGAVLRWQQRLQVVAEPSESWPKEGWVPLR